MLLLLLRPMQMRKLYGWEAEKFSRSSVNLKGGKNRVQTCQRGKVLGKKKKMQVLVRIPETPEIRANETDHPSWRLKSTFKSFPSLIKMIWFYLTCLPERKNSFFKSTQKTSNCLCKFSYAIFGINSKTVQHIRNQDQITNQEKKHQLKDTHRRSRYWCY